MEWGFSGSYAVVAAFRYGLRSALAREASRPMAGGFAGSFHDQGLTVHFLRHGKVVDATMKMGGIAMITADHGNAETMTQEDGSPMTAHTTDLVPFILCGAGSELRQGRLADIAPTILDVMGLAVPEEMDGQTLIVK